jgi:hypothetical protein
MRGAGGNAHVVILKQAGSICGHQMAADAVRTPHCRHMTVDLSSVQLLLLASAGRTCLDVLQCRMHIVVKHEHITLQKAINTYKVPSMCQVAWLSFAGPCLAATITLSLWSRTLLGTIHDCPPLLCINYEYRDDALKYYTWLPTQGLEL